MEILKTLVKFSPFPCHPISPTLHCLCSLTHPPSTPRLQETDFYAWINPMFLDTNIQKEIRQTFCSESEINLENFLTDEAYKRLSEALNSEGLAWQLTGPADRQRYEVRREAS